MTGSISRKTYIQMYARNGVGYDRRKGVNARDLKTKAAISGSIPEKEYSTKMIWLLTNGLYAIFCDSTSME